MRVIILLCALIVSVWGGIDLSGYTLTFNQDFTTMSTLGVTSVGPISAANPWIAHRAPRSLDWVNFQDPSGDYQPFSLDGGFLTIRVQRQSDGTYTGGLLSTLDQWGNGFAQKYGYFETSAKLAAGLGTWPAFWLVDRDSVVNANSDSHELDIFEQYGDGPALLRMTRHYWSNSSIPTWGVGTINVEPSDTTGFHQYGLDYQPDYLTFYYDREIISQVPNTIDAAPGLKYDRAMYVMINNAYGGGGASNQPDPALNDGIPRDLQVQYVKVWQGSGGSSLASSATNGAPQYAFDSGWVIQSNQQGIAIEGISLNVSETGELIVYSTPSYSVLWRNNVNSNNCGTYCQYVFQGDGNFVGYDANNAIWSTGTYNENASAVELKNSAPYLSVVNQYGDSVWETPSTATWSTAQLTLNSGESVSLSDVTLSVDSSVAEVYVKTSGGSCGTGCQLVFQNDGNLVLYTSFGAVWGTSTDGNFQAKLIFQNTAPYLSIVGDSGSVLWSSAAPLIYGTSSFTLNNGQSVSVAGATLAADSTVATITVSVSGLVYTLSTGVACGSAGCQLVFQNDGNLVFYAQGSPVWASGTYNNFNAELLFSSTSPYLQIELDDGTVGWSSN